jgi:hypothetical protein
MILSECLYNLASSIILAEAVQLAVSAFEILSAVTDVPAGVLRLECTHALVLADLEAPITFLLVYQRRWGT